MVDIISFGVLVANESPHLTGISPFIKIKEKSLFSNFFFFLSIDKQTFLSQHMLFILSLFHINWKKKSRKYNFEFNIKIFCTWCSFGSNPPIFFFFFYVSTDWQTNKKTQTQDNNMCLIWGKSNKKTKILCHTIMWRIVCKYQTSHNVITYKRIYK